jgi:hypothetical protein
MFAHIERHVPNPDGKSSLLDLSPTFDILFVCANHFLFLCSVDDVNVPVDSKLIEYVRTADFDIECHRQALKLADLSSDKSSSSEDESFWSSEDNVSSATTVELGPHDIPEIEANLYYAGVSPKQRGPKLIYRTSEDVFQAPSGPEAYKRLMRAIIVPDTYDFGSNITWDTIRDQARDLLVMQQFLCSHFVLRLWCYSTRRRSKSHRLISFDSLG